jgi:predicted GIY-YIG superfamily endonuclease
MLGFVYLLHFEEPIAPGRHTCQHYIGYAADLAARIQAHETGHGARITQVARERGIRFQVARLWRGDRALERRLKDRKHAPQLCPICGRGCAVGYAEEIPAETIDDYLLAF